MLCIFPFQAFILSQPHYIKVTYLLIDQLEEGGGAFCLKKQTLEAVYCIADTCCTFFCDGN